MNENIIAICTVLITCSTTLIGVWLKSKITKKDSEDRNQCIINNNNNKNIGKIIILKNEYNDDIYKFISKGSSNESFEELSFDGVKIILEKNNV